MSSIDTKSIVTQLMAIERRPQDLLNSRLSSLKSAQTAWGQISDKLTALKTAAEAVAPSGSLDKLVAVTSDDPTAIGVTATGSITEASTAQIEVLQLASAHTVLMADPFAGSTASDGGRSLTVNIGGQDETFTSDDGTIGGLAREINAAGVGLSARVLQTGSGTYQLSLTSTASGAASAFTVDATGWTGQATARTGADARIKVDGVTITRASNTISDVIEGVELKLKATTTSAVTVSAQRDDDTIVSKVKSLVDAANAALSTVSSVTASSTTASARGVLSTDSVAKSVAQRIRNLVAGGVSGGDGNTTSAALVGISMTRDGKLQFDEAALRSSLSDDPAAVFGALGRGGRSELSGVSVSSVASTAKSAPHVVSVTRAAAQASMVGVPSPPPPPGSTVSLTVVTPNVTQTVEFQTGASYAETAANLTVALRGVGVKVTASGVEDISDPMDPQWQFSVTTDGFGSAQSIEFSGAGAELLGIDGSAEGEDALVTIDGTALTANGQTLSKDGVTYNVSYTAAQLALTGGTATGNVQVNSGLAGALSEIGAEGSSTGMAARAKTSLSDRISELETRIEQWDDRLSKRQSILERRFTVMDTMLAKLNSLSSQMGFTTS